MSSVNHSPVPTGEALFRRRRFSAEEIRRQPEFRAIVASATQDEEKQDTTNESNLKRFRSRSHSVPGIDSGILLNTTSGNFLKPVNYGFNPARRPESALKHHDDEHSLHKNALGNGNIESSTIIIRNDEDMGILVSKKKHLQQPKKMCHSAEEKTDSFLICQKIVLKKKHLNSHEKTLNEMSTVYEEPICGNSGGDNTPQIEIINSDTIGMISPESGTSDTNTWNDGSSNGQGSEHCLRPTQSAPCRTHNVYTDNENVLQKEKPEPTTQNLHIQARKIVNAIRFHTSIKEKRAESEGMDTGKSNMPEEQTNAASCLKYDAKLEKSAVYLRSRNRTFTRATQFMEKPKSGIRQLNVHYSQTNSCHNDRIIFTDLLKHSHIQNGVVADGVFAMERRLYNRRHEKGKSTTFYDRFTPPLNKSIKQQRPQSSPLPKRSANKSPARTVAAKKKERKERIQKKEELIELGYVPTMATLESKGPEAIEEILMSCRHLRVQPEKQPWLYVGEEK